MGGGEANFSIYEDVELTAFVGALTAEACQEAG